MVMLIQIVAPLLIKGLKIQGHSIKEDAIKAEKLLKHYIIRCCGINKVITGKQMLNSC